MPIVLRDYQSTWIAKIREAWKTHRVVLGVNPTGAGKTVSFAEVIRAHRGASMAVVHRREIVAQISLALAGVGVVHRVVAPPATVTMIRRKHLAKLGRSFIDPHAPCGVASAQTLTSKATANDRRTMDWISQVTLGVFDEGHHYTSAGLWGRAVEMLHRAKLLFVTATPERADGTGLGTEELDGGGYCEVMVEGPTTKWLIDQGYLCPFQYCAPPSDLDVAGLAVGKNGDFNPVAMRARVVDSGLVGDVVSQYKQFGAGRRAIVFSTDCETAREQAALFCEQGIPAAMLDGETDPGERERVIAAYQAGEIKVLVNVDLFDEGFDVPAAEICILARPTESLAKYLQMVGRVLRVIYADGYDLTTAEGRLAAIAAGPKPSAVVIDPIRNWERHGMPTWPRVWTLAGSGRKKGDDDTIAMKICKNPMCTSPYEGYHACCPYCGWTPPPAPERAPLDRVDGELAVLDVAAMDALFDRYRRANLSGDEYAQDQLSRGIPPIGRGADAARHRRLLGQREVLQNLIGWWLGMQPPQRDQGEKERRFYLRYGVDLISAFTLDAKQTDALLERLTASFAKDMH